MTGRIAASLDIQLAKAEGERAMQQTAADPDAVDLRLQAMALYISGITPEHTLEARRLLERSVQPRSQFGRVAGPGSPKS